LPAGFVEARTFTFIDREYQRSPNAGIGAAARCSRRADPPVCTENLSSGVVVVKFAKDGM
jgi:hypothetical protein